MAVNSRVTRGGSSPPLAREVCKIACFLCFEADFLWKIENSPPIQKQPPLKRLNLLNWTKNQSQFRWRAFFWRTPDFGRKKPLNFGLRPKNHSQFQWRPFYFFGEHLILGGKNLWISDFGRKITLNFSEDLFFFFGEHLIFGGKNLWISELSEKFRLNFRTNRLKLIQVQWKFESRSFAQFSLFQNSPPPPFSKSWLRAWQWMSIWANISWIDSLNIL